MQLNQLYGVLETCYNNILMNINNFDYKIMQYIRKYICLCLK